VFEGELVGDSTHKVAIKCVDTSMLENPKSVEFHTRERQVLSSINHPNIVRLESVEEISCGGSTFVFFVMEYCGGGIIFV
jgi:serine/threonine protein kinase